jgi:hypothetical protein
MENQPNHNPQVVFLLGEIKGLVEGLRDGQKQTNERITSLETNIGGNMKALEERIDKRMGTMEANVGGIDKRLRTVEQKAAVIGAVSGGAMSFGVALIVEGVKAWLASGGPGK